MRPGSFLSKSIAIPTTDALAELLLAKGHCDPRAVDRARQVAAQTDERLETVLIHLGLLTERGLAQAFAELLDLPIAGPDRYSFDRPLLDDCLPGRFLRQARSLPVACDDDAVVLATADPLDAFTPAAVAAATGRRVTLEVAVPIELEAALDRLYPIQGSAAEGQFADAADTPLEEDAERLRDLASEAPVIRLVNQILTRAVETNASDVHFEPFEDRFRVRYRYDGVLHETDAPPFRLTAAITSRIKIMARTRHRRTPFAAGRQNQTGGARTGD